MDEEGPDDDDDGPPPGLDGLILLLLAASFLDDSADGIIDPIPEFEGTEVERVPKLFVTECNCCCCGMDDDEDNRGAAAEADAGVENGGCWVDEGWREGDEEEEEMLPLSPLTGSPPTGGTACCAAIP